MTADMPIAVCKPRRRGSLGSRAVAYTALFCIQRRVFDATAGRTRSSILDGHRVMLVRCLDARFVAVAKATPVLRLPDPVENNPLRTSHTQMRPSCDPEITLFPSGCTDTLLRPPVYSERPRIPQTLSFALLSKTSMSAASDEAMMTLPPASWYRSDESPERRLEKLASESTLKRSFSVGRLPQYRRSYRAMWLSDAAQHATTS